MSKLFKNYLSDDFMCNGTTLEGFKEAVKEMVLSTQIAVLSPSDTKFLSLIVEPSTIKDRNGNTLKDKSGNNLGMPGYKYFRYIDTNSIGMFNESGIMPSIAKIPEDKFEPSLSKESDKTSRLMLLSGKTNYYFSQKAMATLTTKADVSGWTTITKPSFVRDLHLMEGLAYTKKKVSYVYRTDEINGKTYRKIFAAMSDKYNFIPMSVLYEALELIIEEGILGECHVHSWHIEHDYTQIYVEFPDCVEDFKATYGLPSEVIPGLLLQSSDTGCSSVIIRGTYRIGGCNTYVIENEFARKHSGTITKDDIVAQVNTDIFTQIRKLPEALAALMGINVTPSEMDLSIPDNCQKNETFVRDMMQNTANKLLKGCLSKKQLTLLVDNICDEINGSIHYTAYDLATILMQVPDRIKGLDEGTMVSVKKALAKAPYAKYENVHITLV